MDPPFFSFRKDELQKVVETKKSASIIIPYSSKSILKAYYDLRTSKNIVGKSIQFVNDLVVGGGPVALECAGELCVNYPNSTISVITSGNAFLDRRSKPIQKAATKIMQSYKNAKCYFNRYVTRIEDNRVYFKYKTKKEDVEESFIETEAIIVAVGFRPNTSIFRTYMSDSLASNGFVSVNDYFQVKLNQNIFTNIQLVEETKSFIKKFEMKTIEELHVDEEEDSKLSITTDTDEETEAMNEDELLKLMNEKEDEENLSQSTSQNSEKFSPRYRPQTVISFRGNQSAHMNIFAIGDIIDTTEEKLGYYSEIHGKKLATIISGLEQSINSEDFFKKVKPYVSKPDFTSNIVIGNSGIIIKGDKIIQKGSLAPFGKAAFEKYLLTQVIPS
jgi:NADPH-dependent glutamate synthase beta subunit-like oxidoreductase